MSDVSEHYDNEFYYPDDLSDMELLQKPTYFESDFAIKVDASNERRFDRSTVIFKFGVRIKLHV